MTDEAAVEQVVGEAADEFGELNIFVNNAGCGRSQKPRTPHPSTPGTS